MAIEPAEAPAAEAPHEGKVLTILEHLQELRQRLFIAAGALVVGIAISAWPLTGWFIDFLSQPAEDKVENFNLIYTEPLEYWTSYFRVTLLLGIAIAMPVIVYELLAFVAPGLTKDERRWLIPLVIAATVAFLAGCAFAYYVELPPALNFLLVSTDEVQPLIRIKSYIDFVTRLILVTGLVFELPLLVMGLAKIGVVNSRQLMRLWRYALVGAFVLAAIVTPSIDPITQALVAGPMIVLYFLGVVLARMVEGNPLIRPGGSSN
jgi:sec-independent protein translocase protein TatC